MYIRVNMLQNVVKRAVTGQERVKGIDYVIACVMSIVTCGACTVTTSVAQLLHPV